MFTGRGDDGTTTLFKSKCRILKNRSVIHALGNLDELNSFLGICIATADNYHVLIEGKQILLTVVIQNLQESLFTIQAELGGAQLFIPQQELDHLEYMIRSIEQILPPIKHFIIAGGHPLAASCDYARTLSRRAERSVIEAIEDGFMVAPITKAYLNRLSSILYALARLINHQAQQQEVSPQYHR